jgi:SAM-dependent methyltransferase
MERMDYFIELYCSLPRAGPGDDASTRRAFRLLTDLPREPRILDLGCGPGEQTLELLRLCEGSVVALDLLPRMIERVTDAVNEAGFSDRVEIVQADMNEMKFEPASFDVIWSEGAIYLMGYRNGLAKVKDLVKPGGYVAVSEAVWLEPDPPAEVVELWKPYPEIDDVEHKLEVIADLGYENIGHFVLPASSWTDRYYDPLAERISELEPEWEGVPVAEGVLEEARTEIAVFREHSRYYSYAFFVMRRPVG